MAKSGLDSVKLGDTHRFAKTDTVTVIYAVTSVDTAQGRSVARVEVVNQAGELKAVAEHIMRWATKLSSSQKS